MGPSQNSKLVLLPNPPVILAIGIYDLNLSTICRTVEASCPTTSCPNFVEIQNHDKPIKAELPAPQCEENYYIQFIFLP